MTPIDRFEDFIKKNRRAFDTEKAPPDSWEVVLNDLEGSPTTHWWRPVLWIMVGVILTLSILYVYTEFQKRQVQDEDIMYAELWDYRETNEYLTSQSQYLWNQIKQLHTDQTLEEDLKELDESAAELKAELSNAEGEYRAYIIKSLLRLQQDKMNLLRNVLDELEQTKIPSDDAQIH